MEEAALAAGAKYGEFGRDSKKELQLAIVQIDKDNFGYLTPGWGPEGGTIIDPSALFNTYVDLGYRVTAWMHGHWDSQQNFSATDFGLVWKKPEPTFLVNRKMEVRKLTNDHLQDAYRRMPKEYKRANLNGLKRYYGNTGLPGDVL